MSDQELVWQVVEGAKFALQNDRYPSFAILSNQYGEIISQSQNLSSSEMDPTAHPEINCIRDASKKLRTLDLSNLTLYTSIEPCLMCLFACYWAGIKRIVYVLPKDQLSKKSYESDINTKELIPRINHYIKIEHAPEFEEKVKIMVEIWEDRQRKYWR